MNKIMLLLGLLSVIPVIGETVPDMKSMTPEQRKERMSEIVGGMFEKPGSQKGVINYVNAQNKVDESVIADNIKTLSELTNYKIDLVGGIFSLPSPKLVGDATLFIINDDKLPVLLHAPENRWVSVNVASLNSDDAKPEFFKSRVQKELTRGFCLLAGTQDSNYKDSLLGPVTKPADLDSHVDCKLPVDIVRRFKPYLEPMGITPAIIAPYPQACKQGWAPAPTNDVQRRIWDKIHAMPSKPIPLTKPTK